MIVLSHALELTAGSVGRITKQKLNSRSFIQSASGELSESGEGIGIEGQFRYLTENRMQDEVNK